MTVGGLRDCGWLKGRADVKADIHVMRVLGRVFTGQPTTEDQAIAATRRMHPKDPWFLDGPLWQAGLNICKVTDPLCEECYLHSDCAYTGGELASSAIPKTTKAAKLEPVGKGVYLFPQDHDDEFVEWCHINSKEGFLWNACVPGENIPTTVPLILHGAFPNGKLCQAFRNRHEPNGYRSNLTTTYRKIVSTNLDALEKWAADRQYQTSTCTFCRSAGCFA
jgi:hypothetical protein